MTDCQLEVHVGTHSFKVSGSEAFVKEMFEEHAKPWFEATPTLNAVEILTHLSDSTTKASPQSDEVRNGVSAYENVYDFADDQLKIICDVGGSNNAEKTRRTALAYLFGQSLLGETTIQSEQLRAACTDQGCYDSTNFAQYLKGLKNKVVMNTKAGGGYAVKLTAPGRVEAKKLADELNGSLDG